MIDKNLVKELFDELGMVEMLKDELNMMNKYSVSELREMMVDYTMVLRDMLLIYKDDSEIIVLLQEWKARAELIINRKLN